LVALVVSGAWTTGVSAQIRGVVTARGGVPLEGVAIEVWTANRRIAARLTDSNGRFFFPESIAFQAVTLQVGGLGFKTLDVTVEVDVDDYAIQLEEAPLMLEGLLVTTEESTCEMGRDDAVARQLWQLARLRYHGLMDTLGVATYLAEADTVVPLSKLGPLDLPSLALSQRGSSSLLRFSWSRRIERDGYAFKVRRTDGARPYDSWVYAPLDADFAPHFVDDLFGERHRLVVEHEGPEGWTLAYCPKKDNKPSIKGTIALARDTTFKSIEWLFETPDPVEHAGGRAVFSPPLANHVQAYLLPSEAIVWREVPGGEYLQRYQRFEDWLVAPGDSVPALPLRRNGEGGVARRN
jgi:hypothetical protein